MKIILLQDVAKVGRKYDVADVAAGFARNFLLPKNLAEFATEKSVKKYTQEKSAIDIERKIQKDLFVKNLNSLENTKITIKEKANEQEHLFAGLYKKEIASKIKEQTKLDIPIESIDLKKPIKKLGEYKIKISTEGETRTLNFVVEKEK